MSTRIEVRDISFDVDPGANEVFWRKVNRGRWEPETFDILSAHIIADTLAVDIGAWIGPTALFAAQKARLCVAFEPDPIAYAELQANIDANRGSEWIERLQINNLAISKDGASFVLGAVDGGGKSTSSALFPNLEATWQVAARSLQDVLTEHRQTDQPVFLKMDIEGGEYDLLPHVGEVLADPGIRAYISFHPKFLRQSLKAAADGDASWQAEFAEIHHRVMDALPWERSLVFNQRPDLARAELETEFIAKLKFPRSLLIT